VQLRRAASSLTVVLRQQVVKTGPVSRDFAILLYLCARRLGYEELFIVTLRLDLDTSPLAAACSAVTAALVASRQRAVE